MRGGVMKTKMFIINISALIIVSVSSSFAQISQGGRPYSFTHTVSAESDVKSMPSIDVEKLLQEDNLSPMDEPYRFGYGGDTTISSRAQDGTNLMMWVESGWRNIFSGSYAIAVTSTWYYVGSGTAIESDILFNGEDYLWSDNGAAGRYDVQNITTHELGHAVGLADLYGGDTEKTMYGYANTGETKKSSLHTDDEDGARYVNFDPQTSGTLSENQVWAPNLNNNTISLTNNLNTSAYSLTIKSGATVNLVNGSSRYSITSTGGTITKEAGVTISGLRATLTRNQVLKGLCGLVQTAVNAVTDNDTW